MQDAPRGVVGRLVARLSYPQAARRGRWGVGGSESESTRRVEIGWRRCVFLGYEIGSGGSFFVFLGPNCAFCASEGVFGLRRPY